MFFNRLVVPSIIVSSALIGSVSGASRGDDVKNDKSVRELVTDLQNKIAALEGDLAETKKILLLNQQQQRQQEDERPRGKTRGIKKNSIRGLEEGARRLPGKGGKGKGIKTPDHSICYGGEGEIDAGHVNELFFDGEMARAAIDLGLVELDNDEGLMLEITASSLIINAVGGVVEQAGDGGCCRHLEELGFKRDLQGRFYITGSGIMMRPIVYICPEVIEECETSVCIRDTCVGAGNMAAVQPDSSLPLTATIIGGYQENFDDAGHVHSGYEIHGALDLTTNTVKFYIPSDDVGGEYLYVDLEVMVASGGIHWDLDFEDLPDWTLGEASLGSHLIEITKPKAADSECVFGDETSSFFLAPPPPP